MLKSHIVVKLAETQLLDNIQNGHGLRQSILVDSHGLQLALPNHDGEVSQDRADPSSEQPSRRELPSTSDKALVDKTRVL